MRYLVAAVAVTAMLGGVAHAQTQLDHDVQRTWDNTFNPSPPGDPRTNWERHRDQDVAADRRANAERAGYRHQREAEHAEWCQNHPGTEACGRY